MEDKDDGPTLSSAEKDANSSHQNPVPKVFGNPLLLGKIMSFVIFSKGIIAKNWINSDAFINKGDIQSFRLVANSWLQTVSNLLHVSENNWDPFYELKRVAVDRTRPRGEQTEELRDDKFKKTLDNFINTMSGNLATPNWDQVRVGLLPYHLNFHATFFGTENHERLLDLLTKCASGLVSLNFELPRNLPGVPKKHPNIFQLPSLKYLDIKFTDRRCTGILVPFEVYAGENLQMKFIQSILNGAEKLVALEIGQRVYIDPDDVTYIPAFIRGLKLPQCLQALHINLQQGPLESSVWEQFMGQSPLPNLHTLSISAYEASEDYMKPGLVYKLLTPFQSSLKKLSLLTTINVNDVGHRVPYRLPKLENLKSLQVESMWVMEEIKPDLHSGDVEVRRLDRMLPKVEDLNFKMSSLEVNSWTRYPQKFALVKRLSLQTFPDGNEDDVDDDADEKYNPISLTMEQVSNIHSSFSNLTELKTVVCGPEMYGLRSIFREMTKLKKLIVSVHEGFDTVTQIPLDLIHWDALFVGCSVGIADMLRDVKQQEQGEAMLKNWQQRDRLNEYPSISNLKDLEVLSLETLGIINHHDRTPEIGTWNMEFPDWNLYDVSFRRVFFQMSKLTTMQIHVNAKVSPAIFKEWKDLKGTDLKVEEGLYSKQKQGYEDFMQTGRYTYY